MKIKPAVKVALILALITLVNLALAGNNPIYAGN